MKRGGSRPKGNVFRELGFPDPEAEHLRVRADLLIALQEVVARKGMKQGEVARLLGISQPRTSDLLRGRLDLFSSDALIDYLARVGVGVRLTLDRPKKPGRVA
jgi:predicted XRE-type DNA-binding protein